MSRSITDRAAEISKIALDHGWDAPTWDNFLAKLMLIMTEVQEAEEATGEDVLMEIADVVIRTLDVVYTLDPGLSMSAGDDLDKSGDLFANIRRRVSRSAECYRYGDDYLAIAWLWNTISIIDSTCMRTASNLWVAVDNKIAINRTRPRLHGKKRSVG